MNDGLTAADREKLVGQLSRFPKLEKVVLFGSRAMGTYSPASDIDLALYGDGLTLQDVARLASEIEECDLPVEVDLIRYDTITSEPLKEHIARHGKVFWGKCAWRQTKWGDEISLEYGKGIRGYNAAVGPVRVFGTNGPVGWTSDPLAPGPGVILGGKGAYRGVHYSPNPFFVIDTAYYVVPKTDLDMRWLYYAIIFHKLGEIDDGSPIPSTTRSAVYVRDLEVPPKEEQQAIASILGALDDTIDHNRRMNETLESLARALFKDWFVDFGPTRAKAEGRAPYLAPDLWSLFPACLDGEGKPEGWVLSTIGNEVGVVGGSTPSTKEAAFWDGDISWATPKDLSALRAPVLLETSRKITQAGLDGISSALLPVGTVLLSSRAPIGYLVITDIPVAINQGFIAMRCDKKLSNVHIWLWTGASMEVILQKANGSTFQEISKSSFRPIPIIVPSAPIRAAFDKLVCPLHEKIVANERESRALVNARDFLLPKLLSGEIRIRDAEKASGGML
jgi:type I restriction enzyme S subunit